MKFLLRVVAISLLLLNGCTRQSNIPTSPQNVRDARARARLFGEEAFKSVLDEYVVEFLRRNPTVNTYLGGAGLDPKLGAVDGELRDHSAMALQEEDRWLTSAKQSLEEISATSLSPAQRINRDVALAQIDFQLHLHRVRRHQERSLDTYTDEPFRAVDWQLQGMSQTSEKTYGTAEEWALVAKRVAAIPAFLQVGQDQLSAGIRSGNTPDWRMIIRNGIDTSEADARYFEETLVAIAQQRVSGRHRKQLLAQLRDACKQAAVAYRGLRDFVAANFFDDATRKDNSGLKQQFRADHYAMGEEEYNWAVKNNLRVNKTAGQLYNSALPIVEATRKEMFDLARRIGDKRHMTLPVEGPAAVRVVFDELSKDYPKSDVEMIQWYKDTALRLVNYALKTGIFDVPVDYQTRTHRWIRRDPLLSIVETPPPLRASIDGAAYYPAPPFKNTGVGRFYVTTTDNNIADLKSNNRAALADLAAHEGFPGHDWHYRVMTEYRDNIAGVRWLTPGAVEDSSSMWEDSMAAEGWALYSEALMAEPQPGAPEGFYTPEERLYQLQGKLYRDLRVRIDTGIHTNRMTYAEAVDLFSEIVDFLPGKCSDTTTKQAIMPVGWAESKKASCGSAERAIFRYSKWPTQAITYRLGKDEIFALRKEAATTLGDRFSAKTFHLLFMKQGTIPAGYFKDVLLGEIKETK